VHVHHLGAGAVAVASAPVGVPLVFTNHSAPRTLRERLALRFVLSRADAIVSLAHSHRLRPRAGRQRHVVIPNGIDERLFYPVAGEPPPPPPWTLLYAGQLIALKRVDVLVAALRRLRTRYPLRLRIASHSGEASAELHRLVQECNVADSVDFLGGLTQEALAYEYRNAHLFVLPSESEFLPSVVSEAMLSGTPIVATDVGAVRDQLGSFGKLVVPGDVDALCRAIAAVIDEYPSHALRAPAMREAAKSRFSIPAMVEAHEQLYQSLVGQTAMRLSVRLLPWTLAVGASSRIMHQHK